MKLKLISFSFLFVFFISCGEYNKILKSSDVMVKLEAAKRYFNEGKYDRSATLLEDVVPLLRGTASGEESMYMLAQSYYSMKDYLTASEYFKSYSTAYPKGEYAELASYYKAYGLYLISPDAKFDQADTYKAMQYFQEFIDYYPQSEKKEAAQQALFDMQEKLALKELLAVRLYYNLGDYILYDFPGGNYLSCVITAQNAMRSYSYSKYREEFMYYIYMAKHAMAIKSVDEKRDFRYRDVADEYYSYLNEYPEGKYLKKIQELQKVIEKELNNE